RIRDIHELTTGDVARTGALDLDHVGAEPRQKLGARRTGLDMREIENADTRERFHMTLPYFLFDSALCGLRLPMRPLSLPAAGSITALMSVGAPESIAAFTVRRSSSGVVTCAPTPPKASIMRS